MKTTTLAAVIVAALIVGALLSLNYDFAPKPHVEITGFISTGTSSGSCIGVVNAGFVLNLTNTGAVDAENLTITFSTNETVGSHRQLIYTNSTPPNKHLAEFEMDKPCLIDGIKAEETKCFMFYWPVSSGFDAPPLTATLKSIDAILDQATVTIPPIPNIKIANFVYLGVWHGTRLGGLLDLFSLSYTNLGMTEVKDLTITLNTSRNEKDTDPRPTPNHSYNPYYFLDEMINGDTYRLESLQAKESKNFQKSYLDVGFLLVESFSLTATLKANNTIMDKATIMIPSADETF